MSQLKLTIKPKFEPEDGQGLLSSGYSIQIGDWVLGQGVKRVVLDMTADQKPEITITARPDIVDIDAMAVAETNKSFDDLKVFHDTEEELKRLRHENEALREECQLLDKILLSERRFFVETLQHQAVEDYRKIVHINRMHQKELHGATQDV